jgi:hypothetical protein
MDHDFAGIQPTLIDAVAKLRAAFERSAIQYALIGGLAVGSAAYQHILDQASEALVFGQPVRVATAEGLIVLKLTASRPQDTADIAALLASNRGRLDLAWVEQEWCTLFELDDPRWQQFQKAIREYYERK